jgi:hypothetical protein
MLGHHGIAPDEQALRAVRGAISSAKESTMNPFLSRSFALCYPSLHEPGRGLRFPCDERGSIDIDQLPERARNNYFAARALVGREYAHPKIEAESPRHWNHREQASHNQSRDGASPAVDHDGDDPVPSRDTRRQRPSAEEPDVVEFTSVPS